MSENEGLAFLAAKSNIRRWWLRGRVGKNALNEPYFTSKKQVIEKDFKMLITQYPTRKLLEIYLKD